MVGEEMVTELKYTKNPNLLTKKIPTLIKFSDLTSCFA